MHEKWGHSYLGFIIKMIVKSDAIDFFQILGAVLNLPANQHSQSFPILLKESRNVLQISLQTTQYHPTKVEKIEKSRA